MIEPEVIINVGPPEKHVRWIRFPGDEGILLDTYYPSEILFLSIVGVAVFFLVGYLISYLFFRKKSNPTPKSSLYDL